MAPSAFLVARVQCTCKPGYFAHLLPFVMPSDNLSFVILSEGRDRTLYFCLGSLEGGDDIIFLRLWEGALKCFFGSCSGLNFVLSAGAPAMAREGRPHAVSVL